jgi:hypothetical protein
MIPTPTPGQVTDTLQPRVVLQPDAPYEAGLALSAAGGIVKEANKTPALKSFSNRPVHSTSIRRIANGLYKVVQNFL